MHCSIGMIYREIMINKHFALYTLFACFILGGFAMLQHKNNKQQITIGFGGDTMLGRLTNRMIDTKDYAYPWGNLLPLLHENDLNVINLETTLTHSDNIVPKVFNFKATPDKVETLIAGNIGLVNLANNHMLDFGPSGLDETIKTLQSANIAHAGAGNNIAQATLPAIVERNGIKIGVLGYTDNEPTWQATETKPGINYLKVGDIAKVKRDIDQLKDKVDIVVVSYHWGPNMREKPNQKHIDFAHAMIDAGVDILHGHSAHIFQGIELYKTKVIMYDTGDLVDDYKVTPETRNDLSFLFLVTITKNDKANITNVQLVPTHIDRMQVNLATDNDYDWSIKRMQMLSAPFGHSIHRFAALRTGEE